LKKDSRVSIPTQPDLGNYPNAIEIDTAPDFSMTDGRENGTSVDREYRPGVPTSRFRKNSKIRLGGTSGAGSGVSAAFLTPQPYFKYQIQSINPFWVRIRSDCNARILLAGAFSDCTWRLYSWDSGATTIGQAIAVDFIRIGPNVKINHADHGAPVVQAACFKDATDVSLGPRH